MPSTPTPAGTPTRAASSKASAGPASRAVGTRSTRDTQDTRVSALLRQAQAIISRGSKLFEISDLAAMQAQGDDAAKLLASLPASLPAADPQWAELALELEYVRLFSEFHRGAPGFQVRANSVAALARSAGRSDMLAKILALSAYAFGRVDHLDAQIARIGEVPQVAAPDNHFAWFFVHLALAQSLHWLGAFERTSLHYRPALVHARASEESILEVVALRHMATAQSLEVRQLSAAGRVSPFALAQCETDLLASLAFSRKRAPDRNTTYLELCLADTLLLQGRCAESLAKFEDHIPAAFTSSLVRQGHEATSRKSRCLLALGRPDEALAAGAEALRGMAASMVEHSMEVTVHRDREFVLRALNRPAEADVHKALLEAAQNAINAMRARHLDKLLHALDPLPAKPATSVKAKR